MNSLWSFLGTPRLSRADFAREALASLVVFLIALPLSLGVALASGVPPALGLVSAIIGGLVVGRLAGSPLQVSGPAAGLAVIVFDAVQQHGLAALGAVVLIAGLLQLLGGALRLGRWFSLVPGSVTSGMLAGIGALILFSQVHVLMDAAPTGAPLSDLTALPSRLLDVVLGGPGASAQALAIGLGTLAMIVLWERHRPRSLRSLPGALVGVGAVVAMSALTALPVAMVAIPERLLPDGLGWLPALSQPGVWASGIVLGLVASAEAMLSASAVDELHHDRPKTDHDRELFAQGVGNVVAGVFGALPVTGVIVRSSANVDAGARTRLPAMLHAAALLVLVVVLPSLLAYIPTTALAAVLVYTGARLLAPFKLLAFWRTDRVEAVVFVSTAVAVVAVGLLEGVLLGLAMAGLVRLIRSHDLRIVAHTDDELQHVDLHLMQLVEVEVDRIAVRHRVEGGLQPRGGQEGRRAAQVQ
ncbi:MAG: SulP family inorganic anion transporter, partial [Myxococcota bacterium]